MPTYTLKDIKTQKEHDVNCSYDELQEILDAQPDLIKVLSNSRATSTSPLKIRLFSMSTIFPFTIIFFQFLKQIYKE